MAENAIHAFGRYLKALRVRRGFSLNEVCSRSEPFAERISKGYLSRCENGFQRLALTKAIPLSRIYEVSADALVERMELDLEVDRIGGPETAGKTLQELRVLSQQAINGGYTWHAYAYCRDALAVVGAELLDEFRDFEEQQLVTTQNCATTAMRLGRYRFALHEVNHVYSHEGLNPQRIPEILERVSSCYLRLKELNRALEFADQAILAAKSNPKHTHLGHAYSNRGNVDLALGDGASAAVHFEKAHEAHKAAGRENDMARALQNLGQAYVLLGRLKAARRVIGVAERRLRAMEQRKTLALGRILLGEIELIESHPSRAVDLWREAAEIAKQLNDKTLQFKAEFQLFKYSVAVGDAAASRALARRLRRLSSWVATDASELDEFRRVATSLARSAS